MFNAVLFTIIFIWLFILSIQQANVKQWFSTLQEERNRVLEFIEEAKSNWSKISNQLKNQKDNEKLEKPDD